MRGSKICDFDPEQHRVTMISITEWFCTGLKFSFLAAETKKGNTLQNTTLYNSQEEAAKKERSVLNGNEEGKPKKLNVCKWH